MSSLPNRSRTRIWSDKYQMSKERGEARWRETTEGPTVAEKAEQAGVPLTPVKPKNEGK